MKFSVLFFGCLFLNAILASAQTLRPGSHNLTLQWIGWDKPGIATVTEEKTGYRIKGEQREPSTGDYLTIEGTLTVVDPRLLTFTGKITSKVYHLNNGEPCVREGTYTFRNTGTRKYWRLKEMVNCDIKGAVDYVDIYF